MDDELTAFLSGIYEILRTLENGLYQQQVLTKALLETIRENPKFAASFQGRYADASSGPLAQGHAAVLAVIDTIMKQMKSGQN